MLKVSSTTIWCTLGMSFDPDTGTSTASLSQSNAKVAGIPAVSPIGEARGTYIYGWLFFECTLICNAEVPCPTFSCAVLRKRLQVQIEDNEALCACYRARVITLEARVRLLLEVAQKANLAIAPELLSDDNILEVHMRHEQGLGMGMLVPASNKLSERYNLKRARH